MTKVKVAAFSISLDGFGAGLKQSLKNPLGIRGDELHEWVLKTKFFKKKLLEKKGGTQGIDNDYARQSFDNIGAWILGRAMFGPIRGPWKNDSWKGWWGDNPPYHTPVFVLTHHARPPVKMKGGTTFHFVTDGLKAALKKAKAAAGNKDVRIGGGVATIRHYLSAGEIDEMHLAVSPILLGEGENLLAELNLPKLGYSVSQVVSGETAAHVRIVKR